MARENARAADEQLGLTVERLTRALGVHSGAVDGLAEALEGVAGGLRDLAAAIESAVDVTRRAQAREEAPETVTPRSPRLSGLGASRRCPRCQQGLGRGGWCLD
jgi:hypothetical protein